MGSHVWNRPRSLQILAKPMGSSLNSFLLTGLTHAFFTRGGVMNSFRLSSARGILLAATALGSVLAAAIGVPQAQAQFVCVGNLLGAP